MFRSSRKVVMSQTEKPKSALGRLFCCFRSEESVKDAVVPISKVSIKNPGQKVQDCVACLTDIEVRTKARGTEGIQAPLETLNTEVHSQGARLTEQVEEIERLRSQLCSTEQQLGATARLLQDMLDCKAEVDTVQDASVLEPLPAALNGPVIRACSNKTLDSRDPCITLYKGSNSSSLEDDTTQCLSPFAKARLLTATLDDGLKAIDLLPTQLDNGDLLGTGSTTPRCLSSSLDVAAFTPLTPAASHLPTMFSKDSSPTRGSTPEPSVVESLQLSPSQALILPSTHTQKCLWQGSGPVSGHLPGERESSDSDGVTAQLPAGDMVQAPVLIKTTDHDSTSSSKVADTTETTTTTSDGVTGDQAQGEPAALPAPQMPAMTFGLHLDANTVFEDQRDEDGKLRSVKMPKPQEDYAFVQALQEDVDGVCIGVFDGHNGRGVAEHLCRELPQAIQARVQQQEAVGSINTSGRVTAATRGLHHELRSVLAAQEQALQAEWLAHRGSADTDSGTSQAESGSTAVVAAVIRRTVYAANVGDSRLLVANLDAANKKAVLAFSTEDHDALTNMKERQRILKLGKSIGSEGHVGTVQASRSIGDFQNKVELGEGVQISKADVYKWELGPDALFVVAVSDGVTKFMSDQAILDKVYHHLSHDNNDPQRAAKELVASAIGQYSGNDNTAAVVVCLQKEAPPKQERRRLFGRK